MSKKKQHWNDNDDEVEVIYVYEGAEDDQDAFEFYADVAPDDLEDDDFEDDAPFDASEFADYEEDHDPEPKVLEPGQDFVRRPVVAIVGRPNVGKSRMFNRLSETNRAIVHDFEGVTRDRQYIDAEWYGSHYTLIDTGGFVPSSDEPMLASMRTQAQLAIEEAQAIIFMMDGRAGLTASDEEIAALLRQTAKPVFYVVNKLDAPQNQSQIPGDFYRLGQDLYAISAEHGHGLDALMDQVVEVIPKVSQVQAYPSYVRVAVVGKPNAGKSTTVNALLGEDRLLTSEVAGTTRDSIHTFLHRGERDYLLVDTAGLRRKSTVSARIEAYSVVQAIRSIDMADVVLLVIDATQGVTAQDKKISSVAVTRGCGVIIVVNKWDLIEKTHETAGEFVKEIYHQMPFLDFAPIVFTSAATGQRVHKLLSLVDMAFDSLKRRIKTSELNEFMETVLREHNAPIYRNVRLKVYYTAQVATRPPTFMFVVNRPNGVAPSYRRFLMRRIREQYGFAGVPLQSVVRARKGHDDYS